MKHHCDIKSLIRQTALSGIMLTLLMVITVSAHPSPARAGSVAAPGGSPLTQSLGKVRCIAISPDGQFLAVGGTGGIALYRSDTLELVWQSASDAEVKEIVFSPTGANLLVRDSSYNARLRNAATGEEIPLPEIRWDEASFAPDNSYLVTNEKDTTLSFWNPETGELIATQEVADRPYSLAVMPDDSGVVIGGHKTLTLWDPYNAKALQTLEESSGSIKRLILSPDSSSLAAITETHHLILWNPKTGEQLATAKAFDVGKEYADFSPDGSLLVIGAKQEDDQRILLLVDAHSGETLRLQPIDSIRIVRFSPDGSLLATGGWDGELMLWDGRNGNWLRSLRGHANSVDQVLFSADGSRLATRSWDGALILWDTASGKPLLTAENSHAVFSPDGAILYLVSRAGDISTIDALTGEAVNTVESPVGAIYSAAYSPARDTLAGGTRDGRVTLWDAQSEEVLRVLEGHSGTVTALAFSPDGSLLASGSADKTINIWDTQSGELLFTLTGHKDTVTALAFSPDSSTLASGGGTDDHTVRLWDVQQGAARRTLVEHKDEINIVAYSPDGEWLVTASDDKIIVLRDGHTGDRLHTLDGWAKSAAFSPDGNLLAAGLLDGTILVEDLQARQVRYTLNGHTSKVTNVAFSPDGAVLASVAWNSTAELWDAQTGDHLATPEGVEENIGGISTVVFSPNGDYLLAGTYKKVLIWEARTGRLFTTLEGHTDNIHSIYFVAGGEKIATVSWDGTLKFWPFP